MTNIKINKAIYENKLFKIEDSFLFAVQIPDNSVGCSGSRCSYCEKEVLYGDHVCQHCKTPFIGPFGFPHIKIWERMLWWEKWKKVGEIYSHYPNYGRIAYTNVLHFPLNPNELKKVDKLSDNEFYNYFCKTHYV